MATDILEELTISRLITKERWYRDTNQWDQLRDCYHPDDPRTRIEISWINDTADGFVKASKDMAAGGTNAIHSIHPTDIRIHQNKALADVAASIMIRFDAKGESFELVSYCRLMYRLEKTSQGAWKITHLTVVYVRDMIFSVVPGASLPSAQLSKYRQSYRHLSWVLEQRGFQIRQDLPGVDLPESVAEVTQAQQEWIQTS